MREIAGKRVIGVCGFKNAGKTTLVEKLVRELTAKGYRVSTVKHAHHDFDVDAEGKDSFRHRAAGATEVAVVSQNRWALMHELRGEAPPALEDVIAKLGPCDIVIVEGYKRDSHDKIEVRNVELNHPALAGDDLTVVAVAANGTINIAHVPCFNRDDVTALAEFVVRHCELDSTKPLLRRAGPSDAKAVMELTRKVYAKWVTIAGREPAPMGTDYGKVVSDCWIDLLEKDRKLIGLIHMEPKSDHMYIDNIAVAESEQGKGYLHILLAQADRLARSSQLPELRLLTNKAFSSNLAIYQHLGFEACGEVPHPKGGVTVHFRRRVS